MDVKAFIDSVDKNYVYVFVATLVAIGLALLFAFVSKVLSSKKKKTRGSIMVKQNEQMVRRSTR